MDNNIWIIYLTLGIAISTFGIAIFSFLSVRQMRKSVQASIFHGVMEYMGKLEDVGRLRGLLKKELWDKDKKSLKELKIPNDYEKEYEFHEYDKSRKIRLAESVGRVSASLDRAGCLMLAFLKKNELKHLLNVYGDVFIDYWALCFQYLNYEQIENRYRDIDSRMYFELMAYNALEYFQKQDRNCLTLCIYDKKQGDKELIRRMEDRRERLTKRLLKRKFQLFGNLLMLIK